MKNKVEDIIETLILNHFLTFYRSFAIAQGGDINQAEEMALIMFKSNIAVGAKAKKEVIKEEMRMYLDFHELREGLKDKPVKYQEDYLKIRDKQVEEKVDEILTVAKDIIRAQWNLTQTT